MMYPRLRLARNLLTDDGVIFISIDDNEQANLKKICDEIFGEHNFITNFIWEKTHHFGRQKLNVYENVEYLLCYGKNINGESGLKQLLVENVVTDLEDAPLYNASNPENIITFPAKSTKFNIKDGVYTSTTDEKYQLLTPVEVINGENRNEFKLKFTSRWNPSKVIEEFEKGTKYWVKSDKFAIRAIYSDDKKHFSSVKQAIFTNNNNPLVAKNSFGIKPGTNEQGSSEVNSLVGSKVFSYPKPVSYISYLLGCLFDEKNEKHNDDFIVLDFFSGSSTTAHATMQLNAEDGGNRKFIMVQLPEQTDEKSNAYKAGYETIADIGSERIRRAGDKIIEENPELADTLDIGFKYLELDKSNIKEWNTDFDTFEEEIELLEQVFVEGRSELDIVYEIMLKLGMELTYPLTTFEVDGKAIYDIAFGGLFICLADGIDINVAQAIIERRNEYGTDTITSVVLKDSGFLGRDSDKLNVIQQLIDAGISQETIQTI